MKQWRKRILAPVAELVADCAAEAVSGIDYVFTTICYESSTNFLPLFCYDSSTKKVTIYPLNGNESSTIPWV